MSRPAAASLALALSSAATAQNAIQWRVQDGGNGHWYRVATAGYPLTRDEAADLAASSGAQLASIETDGENDFVRALALATSGGVVNAGGVTVGPWLGARRDPMTGAFGWASGAAWSYTAWCGGEPTGPNWEDAVCYYTPALCWNDRPSDHIGATACRSAVLEWSADCNGDRIVDYGQVLDGSVGDQNANGIPDECEINEEFTAWGQNRYGQQDIPESAHFLTVAGGNLHSLGLTADRRVLAWGSNATGQCNVPIDLVEVVQVAAGGWYGDDDQRAHSLALRRDGTVRAWGNNGYGQCEVPVLLDDVVQIAAGWAHSAALRADGSVVVWGAGATVSGDPHWGQRAVPSDLGSVAAISTRGCHIMARLSEGTLRCWGRNAEGQSSVPAGLGIVVDFAAGSDHSVALQPDGSVRCWGFNMQSQCNVPNSLGPARAVAASMYGSLAIRIDGQVVAWGAIDDPPPGLSNTDRIVSGGYHAIALARRDCNGDGEGDHGQILQGQLADANADGVPDECQSPACGDADLYADGQVDATDLSLILSNWGESKLGDVNRDGTVDAADLAAVLFFWGPCP